MNVMYTKTHQPHVTQVSIVLRSDRKTLYWCVYIIHTHSYPSTQLHAAPSNLRLTKGTLSIPEGPLSSPFNPTLITLIASYTPLVSMSPSNSVAKYPLIPLVGVCAAPLGLSEQITIRTIELRLIYSNCM